MSWNFILLIFIVYVVAMNRRVFWINYVHSPHDQRLTLRGVGNTGKQYTRGLNALHMLHYAFWSDTEETGRYDLAWKDLCSVSECSQ